MKNKKKLFIIGGSCILVLITVVLIAILAVNKDAPEPLPEPNSDVTMTDTSDITILDDITDIEATESDTLNFKVEKIKDDGTGITLDTEETVTNPSEDMATGQKANDVASPIVENTPKDDNIDEDIIIGGNDIQAYNCGVENHHCDGPETHAYILNLEIEGCPYCTKHDCVSFYATDEWGYSCYTPSKCPNYDILKDPVYYCQDCNRPTGNGTNGTCVQFVNGCECEYCCEWVDSRMCHTCR